MSRNEVLKLVEACHHGKSFGSVRREHGTDIYELVRNICVAQGRGSFVGLGCEEGRTIAITGLTSVTAEEMTTRAANTDKLLVAAGL